MTHCRQIMLEELQRRNFAPTTIATYLHAVEQFARHFKCRPDRLNQTHFRAYQAYLLRERKMRPLTARTRSRPSRPSSSQPVAMPSHEVSGWTSTNAVRQSRQNRARTIQNSRSPVRREGRLVVRFTARSCCRTPCSLGPIPDVRGMPASMRGPSARVALAFVDRGGRRGRKSTCNEGEWTSGEGQAVLGCQGLGTGIISIPNGVRVRSREVGRQQGEARDRLR